jgi:hypothetical protein
MPTAMSGSLTPISCGIGRPAVTGGVTTSGPLDRSTGVVLPATIRRPTDRSVDFSSRSGETENDRRRSPELRVDVRYTSKMQTEILLIRHAQSHPRSAVHHSQWPLSDVGTLQARYGANQHDAVAEEIEWFVFSKHVLTTRRTNYKPATPFTASG